MNTNIIELKKGLNTAFIDATQNSNLAYRPQFVYNDNEKGQKVFSAIEDELRPCGEFAISVGVYYKRRYYAAFADVEGIGT